MTSSIKDRIIHIQFKTQKDMTLTMARVQEFYESPHEHIRNRFFSWDTFMDTYMDDYGEIDYFYMWSGFNIPGKVFKSFFSLFSGSLSKREQNLYETVQHNLGLSTDDFYIIGSLTNDSATTQHELLHAHYYLNEEYREAAKKLVKSLPLESRLSLESSLIKIGYSNEVLTDEINAYLATENKTSIRQIFEYDIRECPVDASMMRPFKTLAKTVLV